MFYADFLDAELTSFAEGFKESDRELRCLNESKYICN